MDLVEQKAIFLFLFLAKKANHHNYSSPSVDKQTGENMCINKLNKKPDKNNIQHPIKTMRSNSVMDIDKVKLLNFFFS